ncbi:MAG: cyclophilin-like fold protein [Candidatus Adiutrix sp.]
MKFFIYLMTLVSLWGSQNAMANDGGGVPIKITVGEQVITAVLNDSPASLEFIRSLPQEISMARLFDREYYAVLPEALPIHGPTQTTYELGDVAFWTRGNYFGLLFSHERPTLSAPIIIMGQVTSDLSVLAALGPAETMLFEVE